MELVDSVEDNTVEEILGMERTAGSIGARWEVQISVEVGMVGHILLE